MVTNSLNDKQILNDMLNTEKYVGSVYETAIMEAANPQVRTALQHILKEEQDHARQIFEMMEQRSWYKVVPANNPH